MARLRSRLAGGAVLGAIALSVLATPAPVHAQAAPGGVRFSSAAVEVEEGTESVRLVVERTGALHVNRLLVDFETESATAKGGSDYADSSGTLSFGLGESFKTVVVRIRDDADTEDREQFLVRLSNARGDAASLGAPATVHIGDDDEPPYEEDGVDLAAAGAPGGQDRRGALPRPSADAPAAVQPSSVASAAAAGVSASRTPPRTAAGQRRPAASSVRRPAPPRTSPVTPFELRPAGAAPSLVRAEPTSVDPLLALLAGLLLARVAAEVWFRSRFDAV